MESNLKDFMKFNKEDPSLVKSIKQLSTEIFYDKKSYEIYNKSEKVLRSFILSYLRPSGNPD